MKNGTSSQTLHATVGGCLACPLLLRCVAYTTDRTPQWMRSDGRMTHHDAMGECPDRDWIMGAVIGIQCNSSSQPTLAILQGLGRVHQWIAGPGVERVA